jgi:hypothetical protein
MQGGQWQLLPLQLLNCPPPQLHPRATLAGLFGILVWLIWVFKNAIRKYTRIPNTRYLGNPF